MEWKPGKTVKRLIVLAAFLFLQAAAGAAPWHYGLLEDFQKSGDVGIIKDEGIQKMSFTLEYPKALVAKGVAESLDQLGLPIEKTNGGTITEYLTHWRVDPEAFLQAKTRKRFRVSLTEIDQTTTGIKFSADVEVSNNYRWLPAPGVNARNAIREAMAVVAIYCRFPNTQEIRASVYDNFKEKAVRVGKNGYELPPAEAWIDLADERPKATKTCPFCAEEILAEAIKCKHCGEFLNKPTSEEPTPPTPPTNGVLTQDATNAPSSSEVLLGEVVDNPENPDETLGARGRLGIGWNPSRSVFIIKIEDTKGAGTFELSPAELIQFAAGYQKAGEVAQTIPAGKLVSTWQCIREDGSSLYTTAAQIPDLRVQVVLIGLQESDKSISSFAAPTWWPASVRLAMHYGKVSTYFDSLLSRALNVAKAQMEAPSPSTSR